MPWGPSPVAHSTWHIMSWQGCTIRGREPTVNVSSFEARTPWMPPTPCLRKKAARSKELLLSWQGRGMSEEMTTSPEEHYYSNFLAGDQNRFAQAGKQSAYNQRSPWNAFNQDSQKDCLQKYLFGGGHITTPAYENQKIKIKNYSRF
jgi:hypothetical protein